MKTLLVAINSRNIHKSPSVWSLKAYCECKGFSVDILECSINDSFAKIFNNIISFNADIIGFSCYIWNIELITKLAKIINQMDKRIKIILGGPEVSFENDFTNFDFASYIVKGEGEIAFYNILNDISINKNDKEKSIIIGECVDINDLPTIYNDDYFFSFKKNQLDIENQLIYYESSRGCPYNCSYCLSSTSSGIKFLNFEKIKIEILKLLENGAKCIKFTDRTFNANKNSTYNILNFVKNLDTNCVFHFEASANLFDDMQYEILKDIQRGRIQFEIGIQSANIKTLENINRQSNIDITLKNIKKLIEINTSSVHLDLIAGLPYDNLDNFKNSINTSIMLKPNKLQIGFLKLLKGTKIREEYTKNNFLFQYFPPYEILQNEWLSCNDLNKIKKIEEMVEIFYNREIFINTIKFILDNVASSPYDFFEELSYKCNEMEGYKVSVKSAFEILYEYLIEKGYKNEGEYYIKLDSFSYDYKGILPKGILSNREKDCELEYKILKNDKSLNIRIEYFAYDNTKKLFIYDVRDKITNHFNYINYKN